MHTIFGANPEQTFSFSDTGNLYAYLQPVQRGWKDISFATSPRSYLLTPAVMKEHLSGLPYLIDREFIVCKYIR